MTERGCGMYLLLFGLWFALNGTITVEVCLFGAAITGALGLLAYALFGYTPRRDLRFLRRFPLFLAYLPALVYEIIRSNLLVLNIILDRRRPVHQSLVVIETDLKTHFARFVLANSITLTPGTITVRTEGNRFTVHCLSREMIEDVESGILYRLLKRMEA